MRTISHVTQPSPVTCCQASLAMATGVPIEDIIEEYGNNGMSDLDFLKVLSSSTSRWNKLVVSSELPPNGIFIVTVPSLNIEGGQHKLVVTTFDNVWEVFDPNFGRKGVKYYNYDGKGEGIPLLGWSNVYMVW